MKNKQTVFDPIIFTKEVLDMFDDTPQCRFLNVDDTLPSKEVEKLLDIQLQLIRYRRSYIRAKEFAETKICTFLPTIQMSDPYEKDVHSERSPFTGNIIARKAIGYMNYPSYIPTCLGPDCMHFDMQTYSCQRTG